VVVRAVVVAHFLHQRRAVREHLDKVMRAVRDYKPIRQHHEAAAVAARAALAQRERQAAMGDRALLVVLADRL
jgi:hypothetical protein